MYSYMHACILASTLRNIHQDHVLESRLRKILGILERGGEFLRSEAESKGVLSAEDILRIQAETLAVSYSTEEEDAFPPERWYALCEEIVFLLCMYVCMYVCSMPVY